MGFLLVAFLKLLSEAKHHSDGVFDVNARNGSGFACLPHDTRVEGWRCVYVRSLLAAAAIVVFGE